MLCKSNNNNNAAWLRVASAWLPAITVCNQQLFPKTIEIAPVRHSVALIGAMDLDWVQDVQSKLLGTGLVTAVDIIDVIESLPSLSDLQQYDCAFIFSDDEFFDPAVIGDTLADYVDSGYGVVVAVFEDTGNNITGRWLSGGYDCMDTQSQDQDEELTLGDVLFPLHPVMKDVHSFDGGSSSYNCPGDVLENTTVIANWSNGHPLVIEKTGFNARIIMLNFYPVSNDIRGDLWHADTDGALIMANAVKYVS